MTTKRSITQMPTPPQEELPMDNHIAERVARNETRMDKIEEQLFARLNAIDDKLNSMAVGMAARRDCPSPGMCLVLKEKLESMDKELTRELEKRESTERDLAKEVIAIQKWMAVVMAVTSLVMTVILFFGPWIRSHLGIPQ